MLGSLLQLVLDLLIFSFFCAAAAVLFRWLSPRYVFAARALAGSFLAAQALATVMGETFEPPTAFARWFWDLDTEWNFATTLAATQLVLVGAIALCLAWLSAKRPAWKRVYFVGVGAFFFFLGCDELFMIHERLFYWEYLYAALGAALTLGMAAVFWNASRIEKLFAACIPIGLAAAAVGAISFDVFSEPCGAWGRIHVFGECVNVYVMEESLEFLGIWMALAGVLGLFSNLSRLPKSSYQRLLYVLPIPLVLVLCGSGPVLPISQQSPDVSAADLRWADSQLHGYQIDEGSQSLAAHLFLSPSGWTFDGLGYSITLIDQSSHEVYAKQDAFANKSLNFLLAPGYNTVWRQWLRLDIPPAVPANRAMWVVLTLWRAADGDFISQPILSSDHALLNDSQVILDELILRAPALPLEGDKPVAEFEGGIKLAAAKLPSRAQAGQELPVTFTWRADEAVADELIQFLHLGHEDSGEWFVYDQHPLDARLPTRLWYDGLSDSETWQAPLPTDLAPGRYAIFTGLYNARDKQRVAARDARGQPYLDARVPIGRIIVQAA